MPILPLLNFCFLFFIHHSVSASAGNHLATHTHFEIATGSIFGSLHILVSAVERVLGFGTPYFIANVVIIVITTLNIIVYKLLELQDQNSDSDQKSSSSSSVNSNLSSEKQLCRFFSLDEIVSATNNFDESLVIGKGGFGKVYKGVIDNGSCTVAIKRSNPLSKQGASQFWAEIKLLSNFRHIHVVSLIGYCDQNREMILVYEFMIHGSLNNYLHKLSKNDKLVILSWVQRLKICIGAARGLDYLHSGTAVLERVIHRDVKSSNILLDQNWAAKISDFGLSRIGPADQEITHISTKHVQGTYGYMDPEYFYTRRFTRKTDVYAFGVVLLEVLSERPAVDRSLPDEDQWSLAGWGQQCINDKVTHHLIGPNLKWEILQTSLVEFVQIAGQCLQSRPNKRPTMSEVVAKLELALSLQLRTNELMDDDLLITDWPFGSPKNTVSFSNENTDGKPLSAHISGGHNSNLPNKVGDDLEDMPTTSGKITTPNLKKYEFGEIKLATRNFSHPHALNWTVEYTFVYEGWIDETTLGPTRPGAGIRVAFKMLHRMSERGPEKRLVEILGRFSHPNLAKLLGYYHGEESEEFNWDVLVYDLMRDKRFNRMLFCKFTSLSWDARLKIAIGTARALSFLHTATDYQILHRNITTSHISVDEDFNPKFLGFGLEKSYPQFKNFTTPRSPRGYGAPEYIATGHLRLESDIYSFGVVLLEILTGLRVIDERRPENETNLVEWAKPFLSDKKAVQQRLVDPRLNNQYPPKGPFKLASLIFKCLQNDPKHRPSMRKVLESLEQMDPVNSTGSWTSYFTKTSS